MILQGKRKITEKSRQRLKENLNLTPKEAEYFDALVDYNQARTASERQATGARFIQVQRQNFLQPQISADSGLLKDAYGPIVLTTISSSKSAMTAQDVAENLSLDLNRVSDILDVLRSHGLVQENAGAYIASQSTFKVSDAFGNEGLRNFYSYWIHKSVDAINLPPEVRRFRSLQIALSESEFKEVIQKINEFALSVLSKTEHNFLEDRQIYLLNTTLFPVAAVNMQKMG